MTVIFTSDSQDESMGFQLMYDSMDVDQVPEDIPSGNVLYFYYCIILYYRESSTESTTRLPSDESLPSATVVVGRLCFHKRLSFCPRGGLADTLPWADTPRGDRPLGGGH